MPTRSCHSVAIMAIIAALPLAACNTSSPTSPSPTSTAPQPTLAAPEPPPPPARSPAETFTTTTVSFTSDAEHYVGQGKSLTFTLENATFSSAVFNNGGRLWVELRQKNAAPINFWSFNVMTPNFAATSITPGTYNTSHDPLAPALVFSFNGEARGCGSSTGRLVIHEFEVTSDRQALKRFRASFEDYHCSGRSPAMRGEIAILADPWR